MKRNIIGSILTSMISPVFVLLVAMVHYKVTLGNPLEYQTYFDPRFQLFLAAIVFIAFFLSCPLFLYLRRYGGILLKHFLVLGFLWGLIPFLMIANSVVRYEGFVGAMDYLIIFTGGGAVTFSAFWVLSVRRNNWWSKEGG